MYSYLISQMRHFNFTKKGYDAPTGIKPWHELVRYKSDILEEGNAQEKS